MSVADLIPPTHIGALTRNHADPTLRPDRRQAKIWMRVDPALAVAVKEDARRLGLSQAEWWRIAAHAWLHRNGADSGTATILAEVKQAITPETLGNAVKRFAKPYTDASIDMAKRQAAVAKAGRPSRPRFGQR